jgi:PncC family amidohydrolase
MFKNNKNEISTIKDYMLTNNETLAVAESVTAGHLQAALSYADYASKFFQGGITAYNVGQKARHLNIEPIHAISCNCVSEKVAASMAIEVCSMFSSDWGVGVTGYAAPVPECHIKELFVFYSFAYKSKTIYTTKLETTEEDIEAVQHYYVDNVLKDLAEQLAKRSSYTSVVLM